MSKGYVYILTNPHMPGLVKIGRTSGDPRSRAQQLYQTGVPAPFAVADAVLSPDCVELEATMHEIFADVRVSGEREFFAACPNEVARELFKELSEQVSTWASEFMPDHVFAHASEIVSTERIELLSCDLEIPFAYIVSALEDIKPQELLPALERLRARIKDMNDRLEGARAE